MRASASDQSPQNRRFSLPRISRRSLLTSGAAAGALAASGLALMAGTPKTGGTLRGVLTGGTAQDTWDARDHDSLFMMAAAHGAVFDCLTEIAADGALKGELAESWSASEDARLWTFDLRKDVTFHNGKPFVAEDVLESFALHFDPAHPSPAQPLLRDVTGIHALGDHQVQFTLAASNADFPYLLADYHLVIYPAGYVELAMLNGIGTGLYRVESFEPGQRLQATRVSSHYKDGRAGFFEALDFVNVDAPSERLNLLLEGRADAVAQIAPVYATQIAQAEGITLQQLRGNQHFSFALDGRHSLAEADAVQRALKHAVDRQAFVDELLLGYGAAGSDTPVGPSNPFYAGKLGALAHDPEQARHLLRAAGVDQLSLRLIGGSGGQGQAAAAVFAKQLKQVGVDIAVSAQPSQLSLSTSAGRATEDWAMATYLAPGATWNRGGWENPLFDTLLGAARSEMDSTKRRALYGELQQLVAQSGNLIIPAFADHLQATSKAIATPPATGAHYAMDNARFAERWWRA
ncbi:ABC transporter substrate-binding protein [Shimia sp. R9_3]|nr:ABC transporter substrate-binding protein [Shimia sp. R9_3]